MTDVLWVAPAPPVGVAAVHALIVGVSAYDHLAGGSGTPTTEALLGGLGQLSSAATSATRVALWLRDHFAFPSVALGSVRLLASPSPGELPLPGGVSPPPATYDEVRKAVVAWRKDARSAEGNVTLLYVAGHGIQTSNDGGILLLQDAGSPDSLTPLERAVDVASVRRGMVKDPTKPDTVTPAVQYYFYDACRIVPSSAAGYASVVAGVSLDEPKGPAPDSAWVLWGSRSRDYALADAETRTTLFSKALTEVLESRAPADPDGRTVRFGHFGLALETVVAELADSFGEQQNVVNGGAGQLNAPIYLRPEPAGAPAQDGLGADGVGVRGGELHVREVAPIASWRPVTVRATDGRRWVVTVTDASGAVVAEGSTDETLDLPPGRYTASVALPWGGTVDALFSVGEADTEVAVEVDVPEQVTGTTRDAPRLTRQLGPSGGPSSGWCLRFLTWTPTGLAQRSEVTPPAVEVDDVEDDSVAIIMHAHGPVLQYAQLRSDDGRSVVVALPIISMAEFETTCWLHVRVSQAALGAVVRFTNPSRDAVAGYLVGGRPDHAVALAPSAESMLMSKMRDPIGAALGGYALLRLNELDRIHDWADNLARFFEWLPDGAVIAGELAARQGNDEVAASWLTQAAARGVPLFTEGLSLLANRVPQLLVDPDVDEPARRELADRTGPLLALSPGAEFGALAATLRVDPDPNDVTAEHGWRRFVRASRPDDPRAFWREP